MRPGRLKRWPIKPQERAALLAAQQMVDRVMRHGCTPDEIAQAQAEIEAAREPRQPQLPLRLQR